MPARSAFEGETEPIVPVGVLNVAQPTYDQYFLLPSLLKPVLAEWQSSIWASLAGGAGMSS